MVYFILVVVILLDQVSKAVVSRWDGVSLNTGVSFGWFEQVPVPLLVLGLVLIALGAWWLVRTYFKDQFLAMGLLLGGAVSNLLDRVFLGGVRDWLAIPGTRLYNNLADYAIGLAILLLLWHQWRSIRKPPHIYD